MRIGQLARKYDLQVLEIIDYLENQLPITDTYHPNFRLDEQSVLSVLEHFNISPEVAVDFETDEDPSIVYDTTLNPDPADEKDAIQEEPEPEVLIHEPQTPEEDIALVEGEIEMTPSDNTFVQPQKQEEAPSSSALHEEDEVIQSDQLLELLDSEEASPDLERIKLIKAPKRELSGLKVLGKVELPEPKKRVAEDDKTKGSHQKRGQRKQPSEEEREKRRLREKRKREAYEARQEKRRKEKEAKEKKALKEAHYKQKIAGTKPQQYKQQVRQQPVKKQVENNQSRPQPKTWVGMFWRWLNP